MALTINPATKVISIPQADLTLITGTLYELDTNQFRKDVMALLDDEAYIWMEDAFSHNTEVSVAGVTYARVIEFINGWSIEFEDGQYTVRLDGSNNNIFDVENGILVQNQVQIISQNSAGLIKADTSDIAGAVWDELTVGHTLPGTFGEEVSANLDAIQEDIDTADLTAVKARVADIQDEIRRLAIQQGILIQQVQALEPSV